MQFQVLEITILLNHSIVLLKNVRQLNNENNNNNLFTKNDYSIFT